MVHIGGRIGHAVPTPVSGSTEGKRTHDFHCNMFKRFSDNRQ